MLFAGIDISKTTFDCVVLIDGDYRHKKISNDLIGFKALSNWLKPHKAPILFCMEATGIYGVALAKYLYQKKMPIVVVNPLKTHAFSKMEMVRNKTDKSDAASISRYCKHLFDQGDWEQKCFKPKAIGFERLNLLVTRLDQLNKISNQEKNRLQVSLDKATSRSIKTMIKYTRTQINQIEKEIEKMVTHEPELHKQISLLISIDGIGRKTAWSLLAYLGDISLFSHARQVTSYAGLNPKICQSGSSINTTSLSKVGNKRLRKALYMPALVATRYNPLMVEFYERLKMNGKPKKVALCGVMRKLLVLSYGVLKSGVPFDVNYAK
tara:strand:- start:1780 stop:2748 length:969 start_codon:yes stop_codon:yes gene_type:complete